MLTHLKHRSMLTLKLDGGEEVISTDSHAFFYRNFTNLFTLQEGSCLLKDPWISDGSTAYKNSINTISLKSIAGLLRGSDISISKDGNMHTRIALHFAYKCPIGIPLIHLRFGSAVDTESGNSDILQLFS